MLPNTLKLELIGNRPPPDSFRIFVHPGSDLVHQAQAEGRICMILVGNHREIPHGRFRGPSSDTMPGESTRTAVSRLAELPV